MMINKKSGRGVFHLPGSGPLLHRTGDRRSPFYCEKKNLYIQNITNRSTFSAANNFVQVMKPLPQVAVVGDTTGGGSGMPFSSEMPIGWAVRFSASPVYDADMNLTENGIEPSPGGKIDMDPKAALDGHDTILDFAIDAIVRHAEENKKATTVPLTLP